MVDKTVNAGVTAQQGFALQRNMALFIILDSYHEKYLTSDYFVTLEHLEDLLFCFVDSHGRPVCVDAYQAKKNSSSSWRINKKFTEIIEKLLDTGIKLNLDALPKSDTYSHKLYFSSNSSMDLEAKIKDSEGKLKSIRHVINEQDILCSYNSLDENIRKKIKDSFNESLSSEHINELNNLNFGFIHFTRTDKEQKIQLYGKLNHVFGNDIIDTKAALESLFSLFDSVGLAFNQKSIARLSDKSKRVSSDEINKAFNVITTKSKAFDYWRDEERNIAKNLRIRPFEKETFSLKFRSAFDYFKINDTSEHNKIFNFVKCNYMDCTSFSEDECINELYISFGKQHTTILDEINLKAVIYAAYFEAVYKKDV
ncbi:TPA: hypothetical protein ACGUTS_004628 [Vibrio vulnificus]